MIRYNKLLFLYMLFLTVIAGSCTKFSDPPVIFEDEPEVVEGKTRKVLLISIDGLAGLELEKYMPKHLGALLENSKYTLSGFADAETGDAASWTTLISGISHTSHGIHGNSFEKEFDENDPHGHNHTGPSTGFVTVFQRLLESGKKINTFSATSLDIIDENLFAYADKREVKANDEEVKKVTVDTLKSVHNNFSFSVVNFRGVNEAGVLHGFDVSNENYKQAIDKVDGYVGEIVSTIKSRVNYENEDWLIVVTSNHGGKENEYGGASMEERKVPIIFYNENFKKVEFKAPELVNSLVVNTKGNVITPTISAANSDLYDIKNGKEYTIMFNVKHNSLPGSSSHAVILGRTTHAYSSNRGWHFMIEGAATGRYRALLGDGMSSQLQVIGDVATLGEWESLALKIYNKSDGKRYARFYVNGKPGTERDITTGRSSFQATAANLFIGSGVTSIASIGTFNGVVNDLVFIDRALTDEEILSFNCMKGINSSAPFWNNVTGYWPMNEGVGAEIKNAISTTSNTNFTFQGSTYQWNLLPQWTCGDESVSENTVLMNHYDIVPQLTYWFDIKIENSWKLEGSIFLDKYESEFIKF